MWYVKISKLCTRDKKYSEGLMNLDCRPSPSARSQGINDED